jgi:hypothetical protein
MADLTAPPLHETTINSTYDGTSETFDQLASTSYDVDTHATASATSDPSQIYWYFAHDAIAINSGETEVLFGSDAINQGNNNIDATSMQWPSGLEVRVHWTGGSINTYNADVQEWYHDGSGMVRRNLVNIQEDDGDSTSSWYSLNSTFSGIYLENNSNDWADFDYIELEFRAPISASVSSKNVVTDDIHK